MRRPSPGSRLALALLAPIIFAEVLASTAPQRIASINLCTDSMLFELVDDSRIVSVTNLSRDPALSYFADRAATMAVNRGLVEEIVALDADLILGDEHAEPLTAQLLQRLGYRVEHFPAPLTLAGFRAGFRRLGELLGERERADRLLATMDERLAAVARKTPKAPRPRALIYRPNGYSPGTRSLAHEVLQAAGYANVAADFALEFGGFIPLESLVATTPDLLIVDRPATRSPALADLVLLHEALDATAPSTGIRRAPVRQDIAGRYWTCAGTYIAEVVESLAALRGD